MNSLRIPDEIIDEVRARALRHLEDRQESLGYYERLTGYSNSCLRSFFSNEPGRRFLNIAQALIDAVPEIGDGMICGECGRLRPPHHDSADADIPTFVR